MQIFYRKEIKKNLLSNRGFTIVGGLVALGLLSISGAGLIHYTNNIRRTSRSTVEKLEYKPYLKATIINNLKSILIEKNIDEDGNPATGDNVNRYGICSLVEKPLKSYGIDKVKLNLFNMPADNTNFGENRWAKFFSRAEWEFLPARECAGMDPVFAVNGLGKCLRYKGTELRTEDSAYAIAQIIPKSFPAFNSIDMNDRQQSVVDAKQVVFYLRTLIMDHAGAQEGSSTYTASALSDIIWANEVGECYIRAVDGNKTVVKFSGTGPGTTFKKNVFNSPLFEGDSKCNILELRDLNQDTVQAGTTEDLRLRTLAALNVKVSCTKNKFKCKSRIYQDSTGYDDLQFSFNIHNRLPGPIPVKAVNFTLKKGKTEWDGKEDQKLDSANVSLAYSGGGDTEEIKGNQNIAGFNVRKGGGGFHLTAKNTSQVCHNICRTYKPNKVGTYIYPVINIHENKNQNACVFKKDYSNDVGNRVHCTVCHTKSCHRYGLNTFGPLKTETQVLITSSQQKSQQVVLGLSDEPLDGQVPECLARHSYNASRGFSAKARATEDPKRFFSLGELSAKGIAMKINNLKSFKDFRFPEYTARTQSEMLPVLCFANGHYYPAMELDNNNIKAPLRPVRAVFQDAQKACFNMGRELGRYYDLALLLFNNYRTIKTNPILVPPSSGAGSAAIILPKMHGSSLPDADLLDNEPNDQQMFDFVNNAVRALFLAPPTGFRLSSVLQKKIQQVINAVIRDYSHAWVAMELDAGGFAVTSPPWALMAKDAPFSLYFNKREPHRLVLLRDISFRGEGGAKRIGGRIENPALLSLQERISKPGSPFLTLTHTIRWKGLLPVNKDTDLRFVCQKSNGHFAVTNDTGKANEGPKKCRNEGWKFVPPESSLDYVKLMLDLNPNDEDYPYPDPKLVRTDMSQDAFLYEKPVNFVRSSADGAQSPLAPATIPQAWLALRAVSAPPATEESESVTEESAPATKDSERSPLARDLRLSKNWPEDSLFLKANRKSAIEPVLSPKAYINAQGEVGDEKLPALSQACSVSLSAEKYRKLCVKNHLPYSLVSLDGSCPANTEEVDLQNKRGAFEPLSIKYMAEWIKKGIDSSDKKIVLSNVEGFRNHITSFNQAKKSCTSSG